MQLTLSGVTVNGPRSPARWPIPGRAGATIRSRVSKLDQHGDQERAVAVSALTTLTLDDVTVTNTTITDANATTSVLAVDAGQTLTLWRDHPQRHRRRRHRGQYGRRHGGTIDVTGNSTIDSGATLNDGVVTISDGVTLTLNGVTVNGTTINDGTVANTGVATGATIAVTGSSKLDQGTAITTGQLRYRR